MTACRVGEREAPHWVAWLWTPPSRETVEPGPQWTNLVPSGGLRSTDELSLAREEEVRRCQRLVSLTHKEELVGDVEVAGWGGVERMGGADWSRAPLSWGQE